MQTKEFENIRAIAVVGKGYLKRKLIKIAENIGYLPSEPRATNIFHEDKDTYWDNINYSKKGVPEEVFRGIQEKNYEVLVLPKDWNKALDWVIMQ